jgi:hypothetical protein
MGILDKITGRAKKASGGISDDASLRREGRTEVRYSQRKLSTEERERLIADTRSQLAGLDEQVASSVERLRDLSK